MKSMSYSAVLALVLSFGGVSPSTAMAPGHAAFAAPNGSDSALSALQQAVSFDRRVELVSRPGAPDKCSFKPSKNPLRQRKNECRLA